MNTDKKIINIATMADTLCDSLGSLKTTRPLVGQLLVILVVIIMPSYNIRQISTPEIFKPISSSEDGPAVPVRSIISGWIPPSLARKTDSDILHTSV